MTMLGEEQNQFICPNCGHEWGDDPTQHDYAKVPDIYCPKCDTQVEADIITDTWYVQDKEDFVKKYLKARGFTDEPKSWKCVTEYLESFLIGDDEEEEGLKGGPEWDDAFQIVRKYFGRKPTQEE